MPSFNDSPICQSRLNCIPCRRDKAFREKLEGQFKEKWTCPLNIEIDAPDSDFPPDILEKFNNRKEEMDKIRKKHEEAKNALDELSMALSGENLERLSIIRDLFFPNTKEASKCKNMISVIGEVNQVCCGGKIKKVSAFSCKKHVVCTDKKCNACNDFDLKKV
jgi:hypothetical protein